MTLGTGAARYPTATRRAGTPTLPNYANGERRFCQTSITREASNGSTVVAKAHGGIDLMKVWQVVNGKWDPPPPICVHLKMLTMKGGI